MRLKINISFGLYSLVLLNFVYIISIYFYMNHTIKVDSDIILLYSFLLSIIFYEILKEAKNLSPLFFISLFFLGYAFSGLYFSVNENLFTAKFIRLANIEWSYEELRLILIIILIGYLFLLAGYRFGESYRIAKKLIAENRIKTSKYFILFVYAILVLSILYWIYVSITLAGGPIELIKNMGIYRLLLSEHENITTAPYLVGYTGCYFLFLYFLYRNEKIPFHIWILIFITFFMRVSTGRLSTSVFYLFSFFLMYIYFQGRVRIKKIFTLLSLVFISLLGLYLWRIYSNFKYVGTDLNLNISYLIFGMANWGDIQSIYLAYYYSLNYGLLLGESFFKSFMLIISGFVPFFNYKPFSIGLLFKEKFFPFENTGAPAPGLITEILINVGIIGIPLGMFFIGFLVAVLFKILRERKDAFSLFLVTQISLHSFLLFKVDSSYLKAIFLNIVPLYVFLQISKLANIKSFKHTNKIIYRRKD